MENTINHELASKDLDYAIKVYNVEVGKTLVVPSGAFEITEVVPHMNKLSVSKDGKSYTFPLSAIMANVNAGKASIK